MDQDQDRIVLFGNAVWIWKKEEKNLEIWSEIKLGKILSVMRNIAGKKDENNNSGELYNEIRRAVG